MHGAAIPRLQYSPPAPSPLGRSNYDALDLEDELPDDETSDGECPALYSDLSILDPLRPFDDYDALDEACPVLDFRRPPTPPDEVESEVMREKER